MAFANIKKRTFSWLFLIACTWSCVTYATAEGRAGSSPAARPKMAPGNRFLFIVDTSSAMQRFEHDGRQALFELIHTGLRGHLRTNDTFGVWTFNENIRAGEFPMTFWDPSQAAELATRVTLFAKQHKYEKTSRLSPVLYRVGRMMGSVKDVNILILTCGESRMETNWLTSEFENAWMFGAAEARRLKKPAIVCLTAANGFLTHCSVSTDPCQIILPVPAIPVLAGPPEKTERPPAAPEKTTPKRRLGEVDKNLILVADSVPHSWRGGTATAPIAPSASQEHLDETNKPVQMPTSVIPAGAIIITNPVVQPVQEATVAESVPAVTNPPSAVANLDPGVPAEDTNSAALDPASLSREAVTTSPPGKMEPTARGPVVVHARAPRMTGSLNPAVASPEAPGPNVLLLGFGTVLLVLGALFGWLVHRWMRPARQLSSISRCLGHSKEWPEVPGDETSMPARPE